MHSMVVTLPSATVLASRSAIAMWSAANNANAAIRLPASPAAIEEAMSLSTLRVHGSVDSGSLVPAPLTTSARTKCGYSSGVDRYTGAH